MQNVPKMVAIWWKYGGNCHHIFEMMVNDDDVDDDVVEGLWVITINTKNVIVLFRYRYKYEYVCMRKFLIEIK